MKITFKIFSIILLTSFLISLISLITCFVCLKDFLSIFALLITAWVIGMQSFATEKMATYQVMPAIDARMIYNKKGGTYFWFSNKSNSPGWISWDWTYKSDNNGNNIKTGRYSKLRIAPNEEGIKTADNFFKDPGKDDEVKLQFFVESAFKKLGEEKLDLRIEFEKSYKFDKDNNRWNDTSWSYPTDRSFPLPTETKLCPYCRSQIDINAKKCKYCLSEIDL